MRCAAGWTLGLMIIYLIRCRIDGMVYVGKTARSLHVRLLEHRREAKQDRRACPLYAAIRKHGWLAFRASVVASADSELDLNRTERKLIAAYRRTSKCYNLDARAHGGLMKMMRGPRCFRVSKAHRRKIADGVRASWREIRRAA